MSENERTPDVVKPEKQEDESKPSTSEGSDNLLGIKVTDNQTEVFFRVKRNTPIRRIIDGFCKRTGKDAKSLRFMYDGERLSSEDTPESLGMEDDDTIEALNQQTGGAR